MAIGFAGARDATQLRPIVAVFWPRSSSTPPSVEFLFPDSTDPRNSRRNMPRLGAGLRADERVSESQVARVYSGQAAPSSAQLRASARSCSCDTGGCWRRSPRGFRPGCQAQATSRSVRRCSTSFCGVMPPPAGSSNALHNSPADKPSQAMRNGARRQRGAPGTPLAC